MGSNSINVIAEIVYSDVLRKFLLDAKKNLELPRDCAGFGNVWCEKCWHATPLDREICVNCGEISETTSS